MRWSDGIPLLAAVGWSGSASAHSFGQQYNLPIPFWLYQYAVSLTLLLSFLVIGYFVTETGANRNLAVRCLGIVEAGATRALRQIFSAGALMCLLFCIAAGIAGTNLAYLNINMTLFWVVFVLGVTYAVAGVGDFFGPLNPWLTLSRLWAAATRQGAFGSGRWRYPVNAASYPAVLLYLAFIWMELFSHMTPRMLSSVLLAYTAITLTGMWAFGARVWLEYGEFFGLSFRLVGKCSPLQTRRAADGSLQVLLQQPFIELTKTSAPDRSELLFIVCMLSSTAFDGLHETAPWVNTFWVSLYQAVIPWAGTNIVETYGLFSQLFTAYQTLGLLAMPLIYLALYLVTLWVVKKLSGSPLPLNTLALAFAYTLVPIALVYNLAHYFTLLITQGSQLSHLASDPLGLGWNLFGAPARRQTPLIGMGWVWHTQVALIVAGHLTSVYLAHLVALKRFGTRRLAVFGQLPMLFLMVAYTAAGLWILSLPITAPPNYG
jgi:hypothetical protein